jgi:hypothetical protein
MLAACEGSRAIDVSAEAPHPAADGRFGLACEVHPDACPFACVEIAYTAGAAGAVVVTNCSDLCGGDKGCPSGTVCNVSGFCERTCGSDADCGDPHYEPLIVCRRGICAPNCITEPSVCPVNRSMCLPDGHCAAED